LGKTLKFVITAIYYIAFFAATYYFYDGAKNMYHYWIVTSILNGLFGAILVVYPFNIFREDIAEVIKGWIGWLMIIFILWAISLLIGGY